MIAGFLDSLSLVDQTSTMAVTVNDVQVAFHPLGIEFLKDPGGSSSLVAISAGLEIWLLGTAGGDLRRIVFEFPLDMDTPELKSFLARAWELQQAAVEGVSPEDFASFILDEVAHGHDWDDYWNGIRLTVLLIPSKATVAIG